MTTSLASPPRAEGTRPAKKRVWVLNLLSALPLLFSFTLSSDDAVTRYVTIGCFSLALVASYFSLRRRFNIIGLLLLLLAGYCYGIFFVVLSGEPGV